MNPQMNEFLKCSRRDFLRAASVGAVGAAAATPSLAALPGASAVPATSAVVVHDPDFAVPAGFAVGLGGGAGAVPMVALRGDPVRLWRDGLRDTVAAGSALYGLTLWADLLIFRGLATELRRHVRIVREDAATGRFAWMIA